MCKNFLLTFLPCKSPALFILESNLEHATIWRGHLPPQQKLAASTMAKQYCDCSHCISLLFSFRNLYICDSKRLNQVCNHLLQFAATLLPNFAIEKVVRSKDYSPSVSPICSLQQTSRTGGRLEDM